MENTTILPIVKLQLTQIHQLVYFFLNVQRIIEITNIFRIRFLKATSFGDQESRDKLKKASHHVTDFWKDLSQLWLTKPRIMSSVKIIADAIAEENPISTKNKSTNNKLKFKIKHKA